MLLATNGGLGTVLTLAGPAFGIVTLAVLTGSHRQRDAQAFRRRATRCDVSVDERFLQLAAGFRPTAVLCPGGSDAHRPGPDDRVTHPCCPMPSFSSRALCRSLGLLTLLTAAEVAAERIHSELIPTTLTEFGRSVQLEVVFYRPAGAGPFPTLVFNHGSVRDPGNPSHAKFTWTDGTLARFFTNRGWLVVFPQRRGRGRSGGLHTEGLDVSGTRYTCELDRLILGQERGAADVHEVVQFLLQHPEVDARQMLIGGHSRGAAVSFAYVAEHPEVFAGVVNFMGGLVSDYFCRQTAAAINSAVFNGAGALAGPTLWLYGENDSALSVSQSWRNYRAFLAVGGRGEFHTLRPPPGRDGHFLFSFPELWAPALDAFVEAIPGPYPVLTAAGGAAAASPGGTLTLRVTSPSGADAAYLWFHDGGPLEVAAPGPSLAVTDLQPEEAGLYHATVAEAGVTSNSTAQVVGLAATDRLHGAGTLVGEAILHPNGNRYDQFLLTGAAMSFVAEPGRVARMSFIDLNDDIVQVEFSGSGTLTVVLRAAEEAAPPVNYHQPEVRYRKGHAGIILAGADQTTHVSIFSVGRANAVDQGLFREDVPYDGVADVAYLAIATRNGRFGSVRTGNVSYFATSGFTGLYAPGVAFDGPVVLGDIAAHDEAVPVLTLGSAAEAGVAGGDLHQPNRRAVQVAGLTRVRFIEGRTSHDGLLAVQPNRARFEERRIDVTERIETGP